MINALIMASGYGSRMGQNKLLLDYKGKPLIEHTMDRILECNFNDKIVVTQYKEILDLAERKYIKGAYNKNAHLGQSESIKLGIKNLKPGKGYMFFTGDQPLLDVETIGLLIKTFKDNRECIIVPRYRGRRGGPTIFSDTYKEELLLLEGDNGGKKIINKHMNNVVFVEINNEYALQDIDTNEDYNRLINLKGQ